MALPLIIAGLGALGLGAYFVTHKKAAPLVLKGIAPPGATAVPASYSPPSNSAPAEAGKSAPYTEAQLQMNVQNMNEVANNPDYAGFTQEDLTQFSE